MHSKQAPAAGGLDRNLKLQGPVVTLPSFARRAALAVSGAYDRKAEARPGTGRNGTSPTTQAACVPDAARQAGG
ncbi:hypothetical protein GCM10010341_07300 [Streptomyces noursei]|nr:hypothetical protein GCM10010341_07300 [Streptomyces noursei]